MLSLNKNSQQLKLRFCCWKLKLISSTSFLCLFKPDIMQDAILDLPKRKSFNTFEKFLISKIYVI